MTEDLFALKEEKCKSCGDPVYWIGKKIVNIRKIVIVLPAGDIATGYESHFSTCPQAATWRKPK